MLKFAGLRISDTEREFQELIRRFRIFKCKSSFLYGSFIMYNLKTCVSSKKLRHIITDLKFTGIVSKLPKFYRVTRQFIFKITGQTGHTRYHKA